MTFPHDDTGSLVAFYGDPRAPGFASNLTLVVPPWQMTYEGRPVRGVQIHRKCAASLQAVFAGIHAHFGDNVPECVRRFSGSYNYRPVRGSSRLSSHAFGAAIDLDAEHNPMNRAHNKGTMHPVVIAEFKKQGWFWGGDFNSRQDPMHFQAAHEGLGVQRVSCADDLEGHVVPTVDAEAPPVPSWLIRGDEKPEAPDAPGADISPSMLKSKQGWAAIGLGSGGFVEGLRQVNEVASQVSTAKWNAEQLGLFDLLGLLVHQPLFWVSVFTVIGAAFVWFEHRKYKQLVKELRATQ